MWFIWPPLSLNLHNIFEILHLIHFNGFTRFHNINTTFFNYNLRIYGFSSRWSFYFSLKNRIQTVATEFSLFCLLKKKDVTAMTTKTWNNGGGSLHIYWQWMWRKFKMINSSSCVLVFFIFRMYTNYILFPKSFYQYLYTALINSTKKRS